MMMVLVQRRQARRLCAHLILLLLSPLRSSHHGIRASLVCGVVEKGADVVNK
jgi:hypothetical protein